MEAGAEAHRHENSIDDVVRRLRIVQEDEPCPENAGPHDVEELRPVVVPKPEALLRVAQLVQENEQGDVRDTSAPAALQNMSSRVPHLLGSAKKMSKMCVGSQQALPLREVI